MNSLEQSTSNQSSKAHKFSGGFFLLRYCSWLIHWHKTILIVSLLGAIVGGIYSVELYKNLRTDLEELLPENAQSVRDLKNVLGRLGGLNHLSLVIQSKDVEAGRRFRQALATKLRELPKDMVASVRDNILEERAFFEKNKALYIDLDDWVNIEHYVRARIRYEKKAKNPFSLGIEDDQIEGKPTFDFDGMKQKYAKRAEGVSKFENGYFESRDGQTHVILAFLPGKQTSMATNQQLSHTAHKIVEDLNPKSFAPDMVVGFSGDVENLVEEHEGLVEDLILSSIVVMALVALVLTVYFRSFVGVYALCASLFAGTAWTFGMSYAIVGYLNANTAFLGSIVVGNGINFGIIMLARYFEERRHGLSAREAMPRSLGFTAQATWTAALAAGLAYGSLVITDFRGFNQFGIIGGLGMVLCWISSFTTLPAFLWWLEKRGWLKIKADGGKHVLAATTARLIVRAHKPILVFSFAITVAAILFSLRLSSATIESDFSKMRNKKSMAQGAGMWSKTVDSVFERYLTPTVILTRNAADTPKVAEEMRKIQKQDGDASSISDIKIVDDFLPQDQPRKIRIIENIQKLLPKQVLAKLSEEDRKIVKDLIPEGEITPVKLNDLPDGVTFHFREQDGTLGNMVHIYPKLSASGEAGRTQKVVNGKVVENNFWDGREIVRFAQQLRDAVRLAGVPAAIAGQPPLTADMISAISKDGPKATAFALIAVMGLVILVFRSWTVSKSVIGALLVGVLWMTGVMGLFNLKVNFLNFIALPITFGIGVDYAVNVFARYFLEGESSIERVVEQTGGAVVLCSATTVIGYSSLLLAGSQAFVSFGQLAVLGEVTCLFVAVVTFPALWHYFEMHRAKRHKN